MWVVRAWSSWFTSELKQGTLTLFFCVVKPLYEQFFDWNCCVDIGSEGKIWKSVQNSLLTAFFTGKMKINLLQTWNIPFSGKQWTFLGLFQVPGKNAIFIKNMVHICVHVFSKKKSQKFVIFLGKMQEISALEVNINSFQQISVKYLPFSHPDFSLITKNLSQIKVYTYFNIGDAKTLVKLNRKIRLNSPGVVPYTHLF